MKKYSNIDYDQRPGSYWEDTDILAALLRNVKGQERRKMIRDYWAQGRLQELDERLLAETLSVEDRDQLGKIHPALMGGEYLPDYHGAEVEIARIELQSTTFDVISIRARRRARGIAYSIVDEYGTEFKLARQSSRKPLTLAELIRFLDESEQPDYEIGLALCYNEVNADSYKDYDLGSREDLREFTRVSSEFYPQLFEHYENVFDEWVKGENDLKPAAQPKGEENHAS